MKKTNLYYKTLYKRTNAVKAFILGLFYSISSYPRLLLEVFIRKSFGERYFSFSTCVWITVFLSIFPYAIVAYSYGQNGFWTVLGNNVTWYLFLIVFLYFAWQRKQEVKREPGVFDFAKFSQSNGIINPIFKNLEIGGNTQTNRTISTLMEPAFFLAIGVVLILCSQRIGFIITFCSICYSLSYFAAYAMGDNFIMDKIDEMICNEELVESFVHNREPSETRGFEPFCRKPADEGFRQKVADSFFEDEEETARAF